MTRGTFAAALALAASGAISTGRVVAASKDEIQRTADKVFARPEFQPPEPTFARWLGEQFVRLMHWLATLSDTSPALFWLLLVAALVVLVLLLAHIGWTVYQVFGVSRRGKVTSAVAEQRRLARRFRDEASAAATAGDYTAAVRLLFLALLYEFEERGSLLLRPALTNREYLATVRDRRELHRGLAVFVNLLDENWYGQQATTERQYAECEELYATLRQRG